MKPDYPIYRKYYSEPVDVAAQVSIPPIVRTVETNLSKETTTDLSYALKKWQERETVINLPKSIISYKDLQMLANQLQSL